MIIAIDPGREKTGVAVVRQDKSLYKKMIIPTEEVVTYIEEILRDEEIQAIVCGDGTNHQAVSDQVEPMAKNYGHVIQLVPEAYTTEEGRKRYWLIHPPTGLRRFLPQGLLYPPVPVDDFTAWIIAERYLDTKGKVNDE